jgi:hypothetical protein
MQVNKISKGETLIDITLTGEEAEFLYSLVGNHCATVDLTMPLYKAFREGIFSDERPQDIFTTNSFGLLEPGKIKPRI